MVHWINWKKTMAEKSQMLLGSARRQETLQQIHLSTKQ